jgi:hypothetical protein
MTICFLSLSVSLSYCCPSTDTSVSTLQALLNTKKCVENWRERFSFLFDDHILLIPMVKTEEERHEGSQKVREKPEKLGESRDLQGE